MKKGKWRLAPLLPLLVMLSACSFGGGGNAAARGEGALLFDGAQANRQTLQTLASRSETYPSLSALLAAPFSQAAWLVSVKPTLVDADSRELTLEVPEEGIVHFKLKRSSTVAGMSGWVGDVESDRKRRYASSGEVDFDPFNWISLVRAGDQVVGDIHIKGQLYRLEPIGAGQHALIKVDESKMPPEGNPILPSDSARVAKNTKHSSSAHSTIRVMFVTTNERRARSPNYRLELVQALQNANQYLINSRVPLTYELADFVDPDYSQDSKSQWAMLQEMANTSTALGAEVSSRRDRMGADLVTLYNTESSICGNAYGWSRKETGFNTISCTVSLAHELGHNLGGGHGLEGTDPAKGYNHGYRHYSPNFHTIQVTSHGAIPYFSNPRLSYQGVAMGTVQNHDVARQFDEYRGVVEDFYPPVPINVTVYDRPGMQGDSCSFDLPPGTKSTTTIEQVCGFAWSHKVWSARINNMTAGKTLRLGNSLAWHSYTSISYSGDFDVPTLSSLHIAMPEGMTVEPHGQNLTKLVSEVVIWPH